MGLFSLKPDPIVGIDISSTAVKLLELSRAGKGYKVESYAMEPLPEKVVEDKTIVNMEVVGQTVTAVVKRAKPRAQYAAVCVAGPAVMTKVVTMDKGMSEADIKAELEMNSKQYVNNELKEVYLDFQLLGPNEKEPETRIDVLLAASRRENVDTLLAAVEHMGGMKLRVVDIEKYALESAFVLVAESDPEINPDETIALVEVGATSTNFNVLKDKKIVYTREEIFGGRRLTEEIQHRYGLSYEEANLAKRNGTLPEDYETELLEPFKVEIAQQISRMVQFYYSSSSAGKLSHILIAGGCAVIPGLMEQVNNKVGGHVTIVNPFAAMSVGSRVKKKELMNDAPALMIACGLALRSFDEH